MDFDVEGLRVFGFIGFRISGLMGATCRTARETLNSGWAGAGMLLACTELLVTVHPLGLGFRVQGLGFRVSTICIM